MANAVGAALAEICEERQASIRYEQASKKYVVFTQESRTVEDTLEEAKESAVRLTKQEALQAAENAGGRDCEADVEIEDRYIDIFSTGTRKYAETVVTVVVKGKPIWLYK